MVRAVIDENCANEHKKVMLEVLYLKFCFLFSLAGMKELSRLLPIPCYLEVIDYLIVLNKWQLWMYRFKVSESKATSLDFMPEDS